MKNNLSFKISQIKNCFSSLKFNEELHKYYVNDEPLKESVSSKIKQFVEYVDFKAIANKKDEEQGLDKNTTSDNWKTKANNACDFGTIVHKFGEDYILNKTLVPQNKRQEQLKIFIDSLPKHLIPVITELQMYHKEFLYGGTCDLLLYNLKTDNFVLVDYKTNESLTKNFKGKKLLAPFNNLLENNLNKYQIQLAYYKLLFEQTGFTVENSYIVWLQDDTYERIKVEDYSKEIAEL
jgi:ATP-dependent exoDNAse (exonuclease V) beta subunit